MNRGNPRIDAIIRSLRQFARRAEPGTPLHPVDLRQTFNAAWELLSMRHKPQQGTLTLPDRSVWVAGDEVRIQQVLVNVLANALDACPVAAKIDVHWQAEGSLFCLLMMMPMFSTLTPCCLNRRDIMYSHAVTLLMPEIGCRPTGQGLS